MTIEEKAKAYDEVLEKANALYKAAEPMSGCNVMNKICTSVEQSKKLIELEIDVNTADMFYADLLVDGNHKYNLHPLESYGFKTFGETKLKISNRLGFIPAWSLAALLDVLPKQIGRYTKTLYWFDDAWHCEYVDEDSEGKYGVTADNHVDACYDMIIKLKEKNLI